MTTNILEHSPTFMRWSAAVYGDYEMVVSRFVCHKNWDFETFKSIASETRTSLLHHCTVGRGIFMNKQYETITTILMQVARDFWLDFPMKEFLANLFTDEYFQNPEPTYRIKAMLAGFYLTYLMFKSQGVRGTIKIQLDTRDLTAFYYFKLCIAESYEITKCIKSSLAYLLNDLVLDEAFMLVGESKQFGIGLNIRNYNNCLETSVVREKLAEKDSDMKSSREANWDLFKNLAKYDTEKQRILKMAYGGLFAPFQQADSASTNCGVTSPGMELNCNNGAVVATTHPTAQVVLAHPDRLLPQPWLWTLFSELSNQHVMFDSPKMSIQNLLADDRVEGIMITTALRMLKRKCAKEDKKTWSNATAGSSGYNCRSYISSQP